MASSETTRKNQENYFRMQLLLYLSKDVLIDVLNKQLQSRYPGLFGPSCNGDISGVLNDQTVKHNLLSLKVKKVLNVSQMKILYPPGSPAPPVTLQDLDITLAVVLLRNITHLNPRARWGNPPATDTSTEANIGRVKGYRNKNAHGTDGLSDADFQRHFTDLKATLLSLSTLYTSDDYDKLLIQPLDASETPCQLLTTALPGMNTELKGRDEILSTINQHISEKVPLVLLAGMGGIGKTSIAVKVGQQKQNVLYIDMRQVSDLKSVKLSLVQHYHPTRHLKDLYSDYENIFKQILCGLTVATFLILDNNDSIISSNREEFIGFLKDVMNSTNHITLLCTCREKFDFTTHNMVVLDIPPVDKASSREIMWERKSTSPTDTELKALDEMAEMCGHSPLALKLLAALLAYKPTGGVLGQMKTQKILRTLSIPSMSEGITTCFDISYETLEPEARKLFLALHIFPVAFTLKEVSDILGLDPNDCEHVLDSLANRSLISADNDIYDIHPLVREYAAFNANSENDILEIQRAYCSYYIKAFKMLKIKNVGPSKTNILSHMKHTAALLIKHLEIQQVPEKLETIDNLTEIANALYKFYLYRDALHLTKVVAHEREVLQGPNHLETASSYNNIGRVQQAMGEYKEALDYYKKCLALAEKMLGPKHPDTASCYSNVGTMLQAMGEYKKALDYHNKSLAIRKETLGPIHPFTATFHRNVGTVLLNIGEHKKALYHNKKGLAVQEQTLGPNHPDTAACYDNIGRVLQAMGEYQRALDFHIKCIAVREKMLGPNHRNTADSYNNIGILLQAMGEYKEALDYYEKCLAVREEILGPNHPDTAASYNNIGSVLRAMGEYKRALDNLKKCLTLRLEILGPNHPDTANSYEGIALAMYDFGEYQNALDYSKTCLAVKLKILGPSHPDTASTYNNIGSELLHMGDYKKALDNYNKCLKVRKELLGPNHRNTADSYNNIGGVLNAMGEYKEALDHYNKCLAVREEILGLNHPDTADSYNNIGNALQAMGEYKKALDYHKKCLAMREEMLGPKHPDIAASYNNIGVLLQAMGEYKKALDYYKKCLAVREEILGPKHPDTAASYNNIGILLQAMGEYKKALDYHKNCLAVREEILGPKHPDIAASYNNIGNVLQATGEYKEALDYHNKCLAVREEILGPNHPDTVRTIKLLDHLSKMHHGNLVRVPWCTMFSRLLGQVFHLYLKWETTFL